MKDKNEYINPIDKIINNLETERNRRIDAYLSNRFCDNETLLNNIAILHAGIDVMRKQTTE